MKHRGIAIVAAFSLLAACGGDSATNVIDSAISGTLSFNYTGGGGGTFSATGGITSAALASSPYTTTWAAGFKEASDNSTNIAANIPRGTGVSDIAGITVKGQSTGTFTIDANCIATDASTCNDVLLFTGFNSATEAFSNLCSFTNGTITITTLSSTKAIGSFTGTGTCSSSSGALSSWVVTNGAFNVPLLVNVPSNIP